MCSPKKKEKKSEVFQKAWVMQKCICFLKNFEFVNFEGEKILKNSECNLCRVEKDLFHSLDLNNGTHPQINFSWGLQKMMHKFYFEKWMSFFF